VQHFADHEGLALPVTVDQDMGLKYDWDRRIGFDPPDAYFEIKYLKTVGQPSSTAFPCLILSPR
jgi:hypothetical protein